MSNYPMGAERDPSAPYNQPPQTEWEYSCGSYTCRRCKEPDVEVDEDDICENCFEPEDIIRGYDDDDC